MPQLLAAVDEPWAEQGVQQVDLADAEHQPVKLQFNRLKIVNARKPTNKQPVNRQLATGAPLKHRRLHIHALITRFLFHFNL